jgi:hypothetical protein
MPATLTSSRPVVATPRTGIDPYGEADSFEREPRVAVPLTMHLSFVDLMGLLVAYPYDCFISDDEFGDDAAVREAVLYTFADATMRNLEDWSQQAMAIYANPRAHGTLGTRALSCAVAIQRVFGLTAPGGAR